MMLAALLALPLLACSEGDEPSRAPLPIVPLEAETASMQASASADPAAAPERDSPHPPAGECIASDTQLTQAIAGEYRTLVAESIQGSKVESGNVAVHRYMRSGEWSTVFASVPVADPGFFVFEEVDGNARFKDVWAGLAGEGDRPALAAWARSLGAPEGFAACFAETVIN